MTTTVDEQDTEPLAAASPAVVKQAASYLGTSAKGLQTCLDRGYTAKQAAQYLGQSVKGIQTAFGKFAILSLGVTTNAAGGQVAISITGSTPGGTVAVTWGDAGNDNVVCDAQGNGTKSHTYAAQGAYTINASQSGRNATPVTVTTKP